MKDLRLTIQKINNGYFVIRGGDWLKSETVTYFPNLEDCLNHIRTMYLDTPKVKESS